MAEKHAPANLTPTQEELAKVFSLETFRSEQHRAIYANVCRVTASPWDLQIMIGRAEEFGGKTRLIEEATVYLSPAQAKALANVLAKQVGLYEKTFGEIKVPEVVLRPIDKPKAKTVKST